MPLTMHPNAYILFTVNTLPLFPINVNVWGNMLIVGINNIVIKIVDIKIWYFNTFSIEFIVTVKKFTQSTDRIEAIIPTLVMINGKYNASTVVINSIDVEEITRAAHVDSVKDPNKSAPIPVILPTLLPTLSAIVPGLLGSSSLKFYIVFPARSAPIFAAFVYIPPPTLANNATNDAPSPYPAIISNNLNTSFIAFFCLSFCDNY